MNYVCWENMLPFMFKMHVIASFLSAPEFSGMGNDEQLFNIPLSLPVCGFTNSNIIFSEKSFLSEGESKFIQSFHRRAFHSPNLMLGILATLMHYFLRKQISRHFPAEVLQVWSRLLVGHKDT